MPIKDSSTRVTVVLDSRTKEILDMVSKNEHRTLANKISQILTGYVDGITDVAVKMMEDDSMDKDEVLDKFLDITYTEYCRKLANRINYISAEIGKVPTKKESQDEDDSPRL